jgi:hypothetical protein
VSSGCRNLQKGGKKQFFFKNSTTDLKIEKRKEKRGSCNRSLLQSWTVLEEEEIGEKLLNLY